MHIDSLNKQTAWYGKGHFVILAPFYFWNGEVRIRKTQSTKPILLSIRDAITHVAVVLHTIQTSKQAHKHNHLLNHPCLVLQ